MAKVKSKAFRKNTKRRNSKKHTKKSKSRRRIRKFRFGGDPTGKFRAENIMGNPYATELNVARKVANQFVPETNVNNIGYSGNNSPSGSSSPSSSSPGSSLSSNPTSYYTNAASRPVVGIVGNKSTTNFAPLPGTYEFLPKLTEREKMIKALPKDDQEMINKYDPLFSNAYDAAMRNGDNPKELATRTVIKYMNVNKKTPKDIAYVLYLNKEPASVDKVNNLLASMYPEEYREEA